MWIDFFLAVSLSLASSAFKHTRWIYHINQIEIPHLMPKEWTESKTIATWLVSTWENFFRLTNTHTLDLRIQYAEHNKWCGTCCAYSFIRKIKRNCGRTVCQSLSSLAHMRYSVNLKEFYIKLQFNLSTRSKSTGFIRRSRRFHSIHQRTNEPKRTSILEQNHFPND